MLKVFQRRLLQEVGVVVGVIYTTVRHLPPNKLKLFLYRIQIGEQLSEIDKENRIAFAQLWTRKLQEKKHFLIRIIFSDEWSYSLHKAVDEQNCRIWGSQRPKSVYKSSRRFPRLMVWYAISENEITDPYVLDDAGVTEDRYKNILRYYLLSEFPNYLFDIMVPQKWAPPHCAILVRQYWEHSSLIDGWGGDDWLPGLLDLPTSSRVTSFSGTIWKTKYSESYLRIVLNSR